MLNVRMVATAAGILAASLISLSPAKALPVAYDGPFYLSLEVVANEYDVSNVVAFTSNPTAGSGTASGQFSIPQGPSIFNLPPVLPGPYSDTSVFLIGITAPGAVETPDHLTLFTNPTSAISFSGAPFSSVYAGDTEAQLVYDLLNHTDDGDVRLNNFADYMFAALHGFIVGNPFSITAFSDGEIIGGGTSSFTAATPIPAALPLFASGLGVMGLLGWRRKRKVALAA